MSYIKISDPNIVDLSAWHQVINVVNQHSDTITAITNNFGASSTSADWTTPGLPHLYDPGSQSIIYGREAASANATVSGSVYYGTITFSNPTTGTNAFSSVPIVTATLQFNNYQDDEDLICSVYGVTALGFSYRIYRARGGLATLNSSKNGVTTTVSPVAVDSGKTFFLNWTAIGPK
jgi:hypothetical protein